MDRIKKLLKAARTDLRKIKRSRAKAHADHTRHTGEEHREFEESSFLYIKSNEDDTGVRPTDPP